MKNNKITAEEQKIKTQANLGNLILKERLADENDWQHYVYHQTGTSALHGIPTMLEHNWDS